MIITSLPEVLCIHLKRFRFDSYFSSKISRHIGFPLSKLDLSQFLKTREDASSPSCTYDLNAVITHYGGAGGSVGGRGWLGCAVVNGCVSKCVVFVLV